MRHRRPHPSPRHCPGSAPQAHQTGRGIRKTEQPVRHHTEVDPGNPPASVEQCITGTPTVMVDGKVIENTQQALTAALG
jgi:hypothetical protein